jgi:hypothetical protein
LDTFETPVLATHFFFLKKIARQQLQILRGFVPNEGLAYPELGIGLDFVLKHLAISGYKAIAVKAYKRKQPSEKCGTRCH